MAKSNKLARLTKVNDNFSVSRYDNGFMVEVGGQDEDNNWATVKTVCNTEEELIETIKEYNLKPLNN